MVVLEGLEPGELIAGTASARTKAPSAERTQNKSLIPMGGRGGGGKRR